MKEVFFKFLELNNCKEQFLEDFDCRFNRRKETYENYFYIIDEEDYIIEAFVWKSSKLGKPFWRTLHERWNNKVILKNNKLNQKLHKNKIYFETEEIIYVKS